MPKSRRKPYWSTGSFKETSDPRDPRNICVMEFGSTIRICSALARLGVFYIGDFQNVTEERLMSVVGFGKNSLADVKRILAYYGFELGQKHPGWIRPCDKPLEER